MIASCQQDTVLSFECGAGQVSAGNLGPPLANHASVFMSRDKGLDTVK